MFARIKSLTIIISIMNVQAQKISLAKMILETDNPDILKSVQDVFIAATKQDFWETIPYEQKLEIEKGLADIVSDDTVDYGSVMNKYRN